MPSTTLDIRLQALDWLVAATRHWLFQGQASALESPCGNDVDWKTVGDLAYFHNLEPILYWVVSNNDSPTGTPEWLKQRWEKAYFENFLKNEGYLDVLKVILNKCAEKGIPIIILKGPALIGRIYRDPALRTMSDLDILCPKKDVGRVVDMAREMGYKARAVGDDPAVTQHVSMHNFDTTFLLEFHFRPYETIRNHQLFMEMAWDRREWIDVNDVLCPVLSLEMELVFDLAHLAHHQFDVSLKHLIDIAGLLVFCQDQFNWNETNARLRKFELERVFALTTGFISCVMHLPLSSHIPWSKKENDAHKEFDASLQDLLALLDQPRLMDVKGVIWGFRVSVRNRKGFRDKLVFIKNRIFPFFDATAYQYRIESGGDIFRFYLRRILFYLQRLLLTVTHFPRPFRVSNQGSFAAERAAAKNKLTAQLSRVETIAQRGRSTVV